MYNWLHKLSHFSYKYKSIANVIYKKKLKMKVYVADYRLIEFLTELSILRFVKNKLQINSKQCRKEIKKNLVD